MKKKQIPGSHCKKQKIIPESSRGQFNNRRPIWRFDLLDRDGLFSFDISRKDFDIKLVFEKLIDYGNMSWFEIIKQTHDAKNKTKHHFLEYSSLSKEAIERIRIKKFEEHTDEIFSFALNNKVRIIGLRFNDEFHIVWYDPKHEFCPSSKD
mgnify:CR=1 FL=1